MLSLRNKIASCVATNSVVQFYRASGLIKET